LQCIRGMFVARANCRGELAAADLTRRNKAKLTAATNVHQKLCVVPIVVHGTHCGAWYQL